MATNNNTLSRLLALQQDLLGIIISKVAESDPAAYSSCMQACKTLAASAEDERVCLTLNLAPLVKKPILAFDYLPLMNRCLRHNNPDANYIKGIIRYFLLNHTSNGLHYLRLAADAGNKDAKYLAGIILMCLDRFEEGRGYLIELKWEEDTSIVDTCWKNIKHSLHGIIVVRKPIYRVALQNRQPPNVCLPNDLDTTCGDCFYYKQMKKFIYMI